MAIIKNLRTEFINLQLCPHILDQRWRWPWLTALTQLVPIQTLVNKFCVAFAQLRCTGQERNFRVEIRTISQINPNPSPTSFLRGWLYYIPFFYHHCFIGMMKTVFSRQQHSRLSGKTQHLSKTIIWKRLEGSYKLGKWVFFSSLFYLPSFLLLFFSIWFCSVYWA